jgi:hypothetical protein
MRRTTEVWVLQSTLFRLEPYVWKLTSTVLREACNLVTCFWGGNAPRLLDRRYRQCFCFFSICFQQVKKQKHCPIIAFTGNCLLFFQ